MTLNFAHESLARLGHSHVTSAHLVLGLLTLGAGVACNVLQNFGLSVQSVETYLSSRHSSAESATLQDGIVVGTSAAESFERAKAEAQAQHHTYLGVEHLLLGIVAEEKGEAADLFASVHVDRDEIRRIILAEPQ
jgi:ATP-dependent Clp protease ATP-binding subunit ClpC